MTVTDTEPRYQLLDSNGNVVGSIHIDGNGDLVLEEGTNQNEAVLDSTGTWTVPAVDADEINNETLYASTWGEFATKIGSASAGQRVRLLPENAPYTATSTITIDSPVFADAEGVEIQPDGDSRTVFEVAGQGTFGDPHPQLAAFIRTESSTYSGPAVVVDTASSNYSKSPHLDLVVKNHDSGTDTVQQAGTAVRVGAGDLGGNHITGVFAKLSITGFGTGLSLESGGSTGQYVNGNGFWGEMWDCDTFIDEVQNTGALSGNEYRFQIDQGGNSTYGLRLDGEGSWYRGMLFDADNFSTAAVDFKANATGCHVHAPNKTLDTAVVSGGGTDNFVYDMLQHNVIYDTGTGVTRMLGWNFSFEAAGSGNSPTAGNYPKGVIVQNTDDDTIWIREKVGTNMIQIA